MRLLLIALATVPLFCWTTAYAAGQKEKTLPALIAALKDRDAGPYAANALGRCGARAKEAIPALAEALRDDRVRPFAAHTLGKLGTAALPALTEAARDKDEDMRIDAVVALGM